MQQSGRHGDADSHMPTITKLKMLLKDEHDAAEEYRAYAKTATTKGEAEHFRAMAKDESRHARYIEGMIDRNIKRQLPLWGRRRM